jgi:ABC-type sugar transport system permease subunit
MHFSLSHRKTQTAITIVLFLAPIIIGLLIFQWYPLFTGVRNSLFQMKLINPGAAKFIGLENYVKLFQDPTFYRALLNTFYYLAGVMLIQIPIALGLAIFLNQGIKGTPFIRTAIFAPLVASEAVIVLIWNMMFYPSSGVINVLINTIGIPMQGFLTDPNQAKLVIILMLVWKDVGFSMILLLAGLQGIPSEFYESAAIDGAGKWASFRFVTIPLLKRSLIIATFMATISSFRIFTPILIMTQGGPQDSTINVIYYMYEQAFQFQKLGFASAIAVIMMVLLAIVTFIQSRVLRTEVEY